MTETFDMPIEEFLEHELDFAQSYMRERGELVTMITLISDEYESMVMGMSWNSEEEKETTYALLRAIGVAINVKVILTLSEGWSIDRKEEDFPVIQPSLASDRYEVVVASAATRTPFGYREMRSLMAKTIRDRDGKVSHLEIDRVSGPVKEGGLVTGLMMNHPPNSKMQEAAMKLVTGLCPILEFKKR